jgi:hypothetical protein
MIFHIKRKRYVNAKKKKSDLPSISLKKKKYYQLQLKEDLYLKNKYIFNEILAGSSLKWHINKLYTVWITNEKIYDH